MKPDDDSACELYVTVEFRPNGSNNRVLTSSACFMGKDCLTEAKAYVFAIQATGAVFVNLSESAGYVFGIHTTATSLVNVNIECFSNCGEQILDVTMGEWQFT